MKNAASAILFGCALLISSSAAANEIVIDFEGIAPDTRVDANASPLVISTSQGNVEIDAPDTNTAVNPLNIFDADCGGGDASNCTGNDPDLFAPQQGNVLIVQDETNASQPDDEDAAATFFFDFSHLACEEIEVLGFVSIDATGTSYSTDPSALPGMFTDANLGNLEDGYVGTFTGVIPLPYDIFQLRIDDSGAIDDIKINCIPENDSFLKFDPAAQSILAGQAGFNFHLQMGNPGGFPNAAWSDAELACDTQPLEDLGLVIDLPGINLGRFANVATDVGVDSELVLSGLAQPVINGQFFDVNIPADTSGLATGDYQLDCTLYVPGAAPYTATFDLNIRTQGNQSGGPVNQDTEAEIGFTQSSPVNSNASQWYDTLHVPVEYSNLMPNTIDGHEITCVLSTTGDAYITNAQAWGGFSTVSVSADGTTATFSGATTLQSFQNRNLQLVIDGLYQDTNTSVTCTIDWLDDGMMESDSATLAINN
ncbi:MAG: hypothetical protein AAGA48_19025 [Myxococcota bacterium]